jgi:hypothetical protein
MGSFTLNSLPLVSVSLSYFLMNFCNMYFLVNAKNEQQVAGFGIAFAVEGSSMICPLVSLAGGYYVLAS